MDEARPTIKLGFVSSAYNEEENLGELHRRCRVVHAELEREFRDRLNLRFNMLVADNGSVDDSLDVLKKLRQEDPALEVLIHQSNYGAEASAGNLLQQARVFDISVFLCSDLQDPPEHALEMVRTLLERPELDAVLAVKKNTLESPLLRFARRMYYKALGVTSRGTLVARGYHGFGCYRQSVIKEAATFWTKTDVSVRQCLASAAKAPVFIDYIQAKRVRGSSSYGVWGYWSEAVGVLLSGDAATSRLSLTIGSTGLMLAVLLGVLVVVNSLRENNGYSGGTPTVMGLVLLSFAIQMLMFGILSRQIEGLRMGGLRRRINFRRLGSDH